MQARTVISRVILATLLVLVVVGSARAEEGRARRLLREANPFSQPEPGEGPIHSAFIAGFAGVAPPPPPLPPGVSPRYEPTFFAVPVGWLVRPFHGADGFCRQR